MGIASNPKVLIVTRRMEELCATKALLNGYGFEVATVTNERAAKAAARAARYQGAVVCHHSFSHDERERIASGLRGVNPDLPVVLKCPGCEGYHEHPERIGALPEERSRELVAFARDSQAEQG